MGGVDLNDMLVELHRLPTRAKRWYFSIIGYLVDLALVNSYLIYRRDAKALGIEATVRNSKDFRLQVSKSLCCAERLRGRPAASEKVVKKNQVIVSPRYRPANEIRFDGLHHLPTHCPQGRCKNCKSGKSTVMCKKCNLILCFTKQKNCFYQFHTHTE
jgi:hypothetical protein